LHASPLIALSLTLAIVLYQFRVPLAALFLIVGMLIPPLLLAFAHDLAIHRIRRQFFAVIVSAALMLTLRPTTDHLLGTIDGRQKGTPAVETAACLAQAHSSGDHE